MQNVKGDDGKVTIKVISKYSSARFLLSTIILTLGELTGLWLECVHEPGCWGVSVNRLRCTGIYGCIRHLYEGCTPIMK